MKRVLMGLLVLIGLIVAGCEREVVREYPARPYGRAYPPGRYGREHHRREYHPREYRLSEEATQNGQAEQAGDDIQP
jgi:hypothetical protein